MHVNNNVSFGSRLQLAEKFKFQEFTEKALREKFAKGVPATQMDEFVSIVKKFQTLISKDGDDAYIVSIQPKGDDRIRMICAKGGILSARTGDESLEPIASVGERLKNLYAGISLKATKSILSE